ncbi:hypothetical protein QBC46DRAFT_437068 [Diplogelasinospora grovesii]|uniref:NADPH--hemoprotein reductase n=1 Tax=Diplogelasinospora grovesii TaxID=303347 RepID=A0AAN6N5L6_9PEZI|nr:hypothetical protein QBC46DRAFT_437068 [Diplogelasinospora grovesii]
MPLNNWTECVKLMVKDMLRRVLATGANLTWLANLVPVEVLRTYSISSYYSEELLPSTVNLTISRAEYKLSSTFTSDTDVTCASVRSGFLNPFVSLTDEWVEAEDGILIGVSRPLNFQLPIDRAAPCAYFAGGSGIAPFRSFWQARLATHTNANSAGRDMLYLGAQSREKFCYEEELREYMDAGLLEVHLAFSRDTRGLVYDRRVHDLVVSSMLEVYFPQWGFLLQAISFAEFANSGRQQCDVKQVFKLDVDYLNTALPNRSSIK